MCFVSRALLLVLVLSGCSDLRGSSNGDPVVFGFVGPFGTILGESGRFGAELALREVNARGGVRGRPLELLARGDEANPQKSVEVAEEFAAAKVTAVVGPGNSGNVFVAGSVYETHEIPAVATCATSPIITQLRGDWVYRIASSDAHNAAVLARHVLSTAPRTAVLYSHDGFGRGLGGAFADAFRTQGGTVLHMDPFLRSTEDFGPYLERLQREELEVVFIAGLDSDAGKIIQQARERGMRTRFLGSSAFEMLKKAGPVFDGTLVGMLYHPDSSPAARTFAEAFRAAHGDDPDSFAACAYDAVHLLAQAVEEVGPDRHRIRDYLKTLGQEGGAPAFEGAAGTLRFDEHGDPEEKEYVIGTIRNGAMRLEAAVPSR